MAKKTEVGNLGVGPDRRSVLKGAAASVLLMTQLPAMARAAPSGKLTITVLNFLEQPYSRSSMPIGRSAPTSSSNIRSFRRAMPILSR